MRRVLLSVLALFLIPPTVGFAPQASAQSSEEIYDKLVRSVVAILVPVGKDDYKHGAGVLIDADKRLVLTSYAVVRDAKLVGVTFPIFDAKGQQLTDVQKYMELANVKAGIFAEVLARDKGKNLAVLRLQRSVPTGTQGVKITTKGVSQAESVWGFGHPIDRFDKKKIEGQMFQMTDGRVRGVGVQEFITGDENPAHDFRVNAKTISSTNPLNVGDEGGPLFNSKGELVGIQQRPEDIRAAQLVGLAIDAEEITKFLADNKVEPKGTLALEERPAPAPVDTEALYKKVVRAAVFITSVEKDGFSMGSGSLIDLERRLVVTNYHVVDKNDYVHVQFPFFDKKGEIVTDKKKYIERVPLGLAIRADVQYRDPTRDLAIVKLTKDPPPGTPALPLAAESVRAGATLWNIGSPGAVEQVFSTTRGIVRCIGLQRYDVGGGAEILRINAKVLTVTLPTNPGDSGGPYVNAKGELVAVHHAGQPGANLLSQAIDISELKAFLAEKGYELPGVTPVSKKDPPKKDNTTPKNTTPTPMTSTDEKAADSALRLAKTLAGNEDARERYKERLRDIVKKYPETMAGKEAKRILESLK